MSSRWRAVALALVLAAVLPLSLGTDSTSGPRGGEVASQASDPATSSPAVLGRLNPQSRAVLVPARDLRSSSTVRLDAYVVALLAALVATAALATRSRHDRAGVPGASLVAASAISHRGPPPVA